MAWSLRRYVLLGAICLLIGWNYWVPAYLYPTAAGLYGSGHPDFNIFYVAGLLWLSHENPYLKTQFTPFVYPPPSFPFYGMFALFDLSLASWLWMATYFIVFALAFLALALTFQGERRFFYVSIALLLFFTSYPLLLMMVLGQSDLLIAGLTILSLASQKTKHRFVSALMLSVGILMKGSAIFLLIYFVVFRRDWKYLAYFLACTLAIVGVSLLVVPVQLYWYWIAKVAPTLYSMYELPASQSIIRPLWLAGLGKDALQAASLVGMALFTIFSFYAGPDRSADASRSNTLRADAMFLMNGLIILLLSPRSTIYPYVWVILPLALLLSALLMEEVRIAYLALIGAATFLLNSTLSQPFLNYATLPFAMVGNLILVLSLTVVCLRPSLVIRRVEAAGSTR